ncbi:hypothetical protein KQI61_07765 [Anaerocolumna aminovalerica]|uniref:hypothetical protein n=1 Tax=Anaerocolumna aminovalerica TaxID=1527 RepID=UPI001C0F1B74|nr:hypothetical protein [Anaerocolumna aminovalerica]MBU5332093.1 hypothetical protein [Anaerocolumna aminovalerica]
MNNKLKYTTDEFKIILYDINQNLEVIGEYIGYHRKILIRCKLHDFKWSPYVSGLLHGQGCPICNNSPYAIKEYTDMWTTNPELAKLLVDPDDGYKYKEKSNKKVYFKCNYCGEIIFKSIDKANSNGLCCPNCSDGISYPNKYIYSLLKQCSKNISNLQREFSDKWCKFILNKKVKTCRYDIYFELSNKKYVIEMDGRWHNNDNNINGQTKEESQKIDLIKDNLAIEHDIIPIRIDCNYTDLVNRSTYIKNSILNSELSLLLDLSKVDFNKCDIESMKSCVIEACELFNTGNYDIYMISKELLISTTCVRNYLKQGTKLGLCKYDPKQINILHNCGHNRKIICLTTGQIFNSIKEAKACFGYDMHRQINKKVKYRRKHFEEWMYYDDYLNNKNMYVGNCESQLLFYVEKGGD